MKRRSFLRCLLAVALTAAVGLPSAERFVPYSPGSQTGCWAGWLEVDGKCTGFVRKDGGVWRFPDKAPAKAGK